MDELELLTSLRPSVEPPDRGELEAMWSVAMARGASVDANGRSAVGSSDDPGDLLDVAPRRRSRRRLVAAAVIVLVLAGGGVAAMIGSLRTTSIDIDAAGPPAQKAIDGGSSQYASSVDQASGPADAGPVRAGSLTSAVAVCPPIPSDVVAKAASAFVGSIRSVDAVRAVVAIDVDRSLRGDSGPELLLDVDPRWIAMWSTIGSAPLLVTIDGAERPMGDPTIGSPCTVVEPWSPEREAEWRGAVG